LCKGNEIELPYYQPLDYWTLTTVLSASGCIDSESVILDFTLTNSFYKMKGPMQEKASAERGSGTTTTTDPPTN
jgi:hypothetical protein